MTTNNPSYVPVLIQHPQHNFVQNAQVCFTYISNVPLLSHISMQILGGRDHDLWSNGHLPGIDSVDPQIYPAVNHADAPPPTRYTGIGSEDPPHVAIVSVHFISLRPSFADGGFVEGRWTTSREPKST